MGPKREQSYIISYGFLGFVTRNRALFTGPAQYPKNSAEKLTSINGALTTQNLTIQAVLLFKSS